MNLHDFTGASDGAFPFGSVILDANGNQVMARRE